MALPWTDLRTWHGSQYSAFEELCCQLAMYEPVPEGSIFVRKGVPDSGIECQWELPDGCIWAWQAKYFLSIPNQSQWNQIDKSVKTALQNAPNISQYIVCLPINRSDSPNKSGKGSLAKWNEHVRKWEGWAAVHKSETKFMYWGETEIFDRLSQEEHRGRYWFWFHAEQLSQKWFEDRLEEAIADAGDRYTPELNVDLEISSFFDSLGRTQKFYEEVGRRLISLRRASYDLPHDSDSSIEAELQAGIQNLCLLLESPLPSSPLMLKDCLLRPFQWKEVAARANRISTVCLQAMRKSDSSNTHQESPINENQRPITNLSDRNHYDQYRLERLQDLCDELSELAQSDRATLANKPAMLLVGEAGCGKTHLLCDVAKRDTLSGSPRILLHGFKFTREEPWSQIIRLLGLNITRDEFLGALEAAAQLYQSRILIMIDGLNEGEGRMMWKNHLAGMLIAISRTPWIGIAISVRTSYEEVIVPPSSFNDRLTRVEHKGFREKWFEAVNRFFKYYRIHPSTPLLQPEFTNPLFLKLLCSGVRSLELDRIPQGLQGLSKVLTFYIDATNARLAKPDRLDYDPMDNVVRKALEQLAEKMALENTHQLPRKTVEQLVNTFLPRDGFEKTLFCHLLREGVLAEYSRKSIEGYIEEVRFGFERFADYLKAEYFLNYHLKKVSVKHCFSKGGALGKLFRDESSCSMNRGLLEMLFILIPESVGVDLVTLLPHVTGTTTVSNAFIRSFVWRHSSSFSKDTETYMKETIFPDPYLCEDFLDALLTISPIPDHPYNSDWLHKLLIGQRMADRDVWWSTFLHREWKAERSVDRLVDWAFDELASKAVSDEVIRLIGVALTWFLTTPNRFLRDHTTKALVRLFTSRIDCLCEVIKSFRGVDDPYVIERLLAVAYGCAMRATQRNSLEELALEVFDWIFGTGEPLPHILLRDYARGVIEVALHRNPALTVKTQKIRPPYKSEWPGFDVPDESELKAWGEWSEKMPQVELSRVHLYDSIMNDMEDFSNYVIGDLLEWSPERLGESHKPTHREVVEEFERRLTPREKEAWDGYRNVHRLEVHRFIMGNAGKGSPGSQDAVLQIKDLRTAESHLLSVLGKGSSKAEVFRQIVKPYLNEPQKFSNEENFDGHLARRWIMNRVIDLGWTVSRFGTFDRNVDCLHNQGRSANKPERVGKKYQWIAFHELLARLSDNFKFNPALGDESLQEYHGPWNLPFHRDIDPSNLLKRTNSSRGGPTTQSWWFKTPFDSWTEPHEEIAWLKETAGLPRVESLIEVVEPESDISWLTLEGNYDWEEPTPFDKERYDCVRRRIWYQLRSFLVRTNDTNKVLRWAKKQNFSDWSIPRSDPHASEFFLGEFPWAQSFGDHDTSYHGRDGWTRGYRDRVATEVLVTTDGYYWEAGGFDCSIDETMLIRFPCKEIIQGMDLSWRGKEGCFFDPQGALTAFDPSVSEAGPSTLLIRRSAFERFLCENDLSVVWTVAGAKEIIGGHMTPETYRGELRLNGTYTLKRGSLRGELTSRFHAPRLAAAKNSTNPEGKQLELIEEEDA